VANQVTLEGTSDAARLDTMTDGMFHSLKAIHLTLILSGVEEFSLEDIAASRMISASHAVDPDHRQPPTRDTPARAAGVLRKIINQEQTRFTDYRSSSQSFD
jgi:hypothetical protein